MATRVKLILLLVMMRETYRFPPLGYICLLLPQAQALLLPSRRAFSSTALFRAVHFTVIDTLPSTLLPTMSNSLPQSTLSK